MFDATSFLLGLLAYSFLQKSMKQSRVIAFIVGLMFVIILADVLLQVVTLAGIAEVIQNARAANLQ